MITNPPPILGSPKKPEWATAICELKLKGGNDHNPYYWCNHRSIKRVTSKHEYHPLPIEQRGDYKIWEGSFIEPFSEYIHADKYTQLEF